MYGVMEVKYLLNMYNLEEFDYATTPPHTFYDLIIFQWYLLFYFMYKNLSCHVVQ